LDQLSSGVKYFYRCAIPLVPLYCKQLENKPYPNYQKPEEITMSAKTGFRGLVGMFQKTLMVTLVLVVLFSSLPVGQAYAWGTGERLGTWGGVSNLPMIDLGDITQPYGTYFTVWSSGGPVAQRNPASIGAQNVTATYSLDQYVGTTWRTIKNQSYVLPIGANWYSATFPAVRFELPVQSRGYYRVRLMFHWFASNGAFLGAVEVISTLASDFSCNYSSMRPCQPSAGYFRIGQYGTTLW
jgi:hypothetical protein